MVEIQTVLSEDQFMAGLACHLRHKAKFHHLFIVGALCLLLPMTAYALTQQGLEWVTAFAVIGIICLGIPPATRRAARQNIKEHPHRDHPVTWVLDEEQVRATAPNFEFRVHWNGFRECLITGQGILLYPQANLFYWIPRESFESDEAYQNAVGLVERHIDQTETIGA